MNANYDLDDQWTLTDLDRSRQNKSPVKFFLRGLKSKISKAHKKAPYIFPVLKELEASLRMRIYEDRQIHTKTGFRPIKLQESRSGPHTNRTPSNNILYYTSRAYKRKKKKNKVIYNNEGKMFTSIKNKNKNPHDPTVPPCK